MSNIVRAAAGKGKEITTAPLHQYDYGQILKIEGVELPTGYQVHFSNQPYGTSTTSIGTADGVAIPDAYLQSGEAVYAWLYLHEGEDDGETVLTIRIPVIQRSSITNDEPTPVQQSEIDELIIALNAAVDAAEDAQEAAEDAQADAEDAADDAEGSAEDAEAWAVGQRLGVDVESTDAAYHNNSKYYAQQAAGSATDASTAKTDAVSAKNDAVSAKNAAVSAKEAAEGYKTDAVNAKNAAVRAKNDAVSAKNDAVSAKEAAEEAQDAAEDAESAAEDAQEAAEAARDQILGMSVTATGLPAGSDPTASYSGGVLSLGLVKGDKGDQGDTGATPQLSVGTVTTGDAGTDAEVTIGGTTAAPTLSFAIPKGPKGDAGNGTMLAPAFAVASANDAGSFVTYDGGLYFLPEGHAANATWANTTKTLTNYGAEVGPIKDAIIADIPSDASLWDFGAIDNGGGTIANGSTSIRTRDFLDKGIKEISVATGYKFKIHAWSNGTYQGGYRNNGTWVKTSLVSWFTTRLSLTQFSSYDLKIQIATTDDSAITKAAASSVYFNVKLDKGLKTSGVAADAKATGDKINATETKLLQGIPHETITQTVASDGKSYWAITNNVASIATNTYVNYRAAKVDVVPKDELTLTFVPFTDYGYIFTDGSYNVISYFPWGGNQTTPMQEIKCTVPDGAVYLLINAWGSTNTITVATEKFYETAKKSELATAQTDISTLKNHHDSELVTASDTANLFHYKNWAEGSIDAATGVFTPVTTPATYKWLCSDYIPVRPGVTYLTGATHIIGIYYYKDDFAYLSGETGSLQNYWQQFTPPDKAAFVRLYWYPGNTYTEYASIDEMIRQVGKLYEYGVDVTNIKPTSVKYLHSLYEYDDLFYSNYLKGRTFAVLGDSIGTRQGYNDPEILITDSDVGVELSAYVTYQDVQAGLSINGTTYTDSDIGTEVTFTPAAGDVGKSIGVPLNHGSANAIKWWQIMAARLGMTGWNASWSGATMVSQESRATSYKNYYASCAWYESTLRRCGKRTPGTMTRVAPDYIFIHRGVNDFSTSHSGGSTVLTDNVFSAHNYSIPNDDQITVGGNTKYDFKQAYAMTIQKLRDKYPTSIIICCTLTPFKRHYETHFPPDNGTYSLPQFNAAIREVAAFFGCHVCDFDHCFGFEQLSVYTGDNTHPNEKGQRAMAGKAIITLVNNVRNT